MKKKHIQSISFGGGGPRGLYVYLGLLKRFKETSLWAPSYISGTSIGALMALLLSLRLNYTTINALIASFDITEYQDIQLSKTGIDTGNKIAQFINHLLDQLNYKEKTFLELYQRTKITLIITGTCINHQEVHYLSWATTPHMPIATAIRASTAIPMLYYPVYWHDCCFVDLNDPPKEATINIELTSDATNNMQAHYALRVFGYLANRVNRSRRHQSKNTWVINTKKYNLFNSFNLTFQQKDELFHIGYKTAYAICRNFLDDD